MSLSRASILLQSGFYVFAGFNHFLNPEFYLPLIPDYLGWYEFINYFAGIAEFLLGFGLLFHSTRRMAGLLIIIMLIAFIPSHVHFIQIGSCIEEGLCVSPIIGWLRLLIIHPLLIYWAYSATKVKRITADKT